VLRGVVKPPCPLRTGHDVEVIKIVTVDRGARMIAHRNQRHTAVLDDDCLVKRSVIRVDALKGEALRRIELVIVGLLQERFER
jgi:hypothetical protein